MSDYLSHLARASGLTVGRRPRAGTVAQHGPAATSPHAVRTPGREAGAEAAPAGPPHVERVTFVEQPRAAAHASAESEGAGDEAARTSGEGREGAGARRLEESAIRPPRREGGERDDGRQHAAEASSHTYARETEGFSAAREARPARPASEEGSVRFVRPEDDEGRATREVRRGESLSPGGAGERPEAGRPASHAHAFEEIVLGAPREGATARGAGRQDARGDAADARPLESLDPAEARRAYMREIVEWISAPPSTQTGDGEERERERRREVDEARVAAVVEIVNEREASAASARSRAGDERGPEVDDFTLSIGSIQVVVEEPQGQAAAPPAAPSPAPAQGGRAPDGGDDAVARLRRHYVRL